MSDPNPTRATSIDPRAGALVAAWAVRYSAGRATGAWANALAMVSLVEASLTPAERARVVAEAERAHAIALTNASGLFHNAGEAEDWRDLIERLSARSDEGASDPVPSHGGRTIALAAISAMRIASGSGFAATPEPGAAGAVAEAIASMADEFSPSDRVLLLRDLKERAEEIVRIPEDGPLDPAWSELYLTVSAMALDEDYARVNRLPQTIS